MLGVNLIPGPRIAARARRHRLRVWCVGASLYVVAVVGSAAVWSRVIVPRNAGAIALDEAAARVETAERALVAVRGDIATQRRLVQASRDASRHPDWSILLASLGEACRDEVTLTSVTLEPVVPSAAGAGGARGPASAPVRPRAYALSITGFAQEPGEVSAFVLRLESDGLLSSVLLRDSRRAVMTHGEAVMFQLTAVIGPRPEQTASAEDSR